LVLADGIKNAQATIEAFAGLPEHVRDRTDLVFFSRESMPRPAVAAALVNPRVRFIAQPTTAELVALMNLATVFAFPSWYEGFGLPLVEAMRCGAPIVASSRAAIPEIVGEAGLLFDLEDPDGFRAHLCALLEDAVLRERARAAALARARAFDWCETARRTVSVYESTGAARGRQVA
jgi:glycosyltransferase involved in cell wall biosynthesis